MIRYSFILCASILLLALPACRSNKGSCGAPGITRANNSGFGGHSPSVSGYKRNRDSMSGPTRQHGKR